MLILWAESVMRGWSWLLVACFVAPVSATEPVVSRIAFGSCAHQDRPQPIWSAISATKPQLLLLIGDNIYGDSKDTDVLKAKYAKAAAVPGFAALRSQCKLLATWDDHDYGQNDAGAEYPNKQASQQLLLDFLGVPADSPRRQREGVYDAATFGPVGQRVQVILLDTRYHRSPFKRSETNPRQVVPNTDAGVTILGAAQWKWLEEQLRQPAELRLLVSSIQVVAEDHPFEKWANFPAERERLYKLLASTKANGVIVLSGDRHLAELSVADAGLGYPLFDLTSSGLNMANAKWRPLEANQHRVATMTTGNNFGLIDVEWTANGGPLVRLQIRDEVGDITIQEKQPLSLLKSASATAPATSPPAGVVPVANAGQHVGQKCTLELNVGSLGVPKTGDLMFINSARDFRDETNFTIVLRKDAIANLKKAHGDDLVKFYADKTLRVTGTITQFKGKLQMVVEAAEAIEVVEK